MSPHYLRALPRFLELVGMGDRAAFTFYPGKSDTTVGSLHHRRGTDADGAGSSTMGERTLDELASCQHEFRGIRQLGVYLRIPRNWDRACSKRAGIESVPALRIESDQGSIDEQLAVLEAYQHQMGVRFTINWTGGKSLHAYLTLDEPIHVDHYKWICQAFHDKVRETGEDLEIEYIADPAVSNPSQVMRCPGSIHAETGELCVTIQEGEPCSLEDVFPEMEDLEGFVNQAMRDSVTQPALIHLSQDGLVLGHRGDAARQILLDVAKCWTKRVVGATTYGEVVPLIGGLKNILGVDGAASLLYEAGHNDRDGKHSLQGLAEWCASFGDRGETPSNQLVD